VDSCAAVGPAITSYGPPITTEPVSEFLAHGEWVLQPVAGASVTSLGSVSCPQSNVCLAVGGFVGSGDTVQSVIERWNGSVWAPLALSPSDVSLPPLNAISCTSVFACTAAGTVGPGGAPALSLSTAQPDAIELWGRHVTVDAPPPLSSGFSGGIVESLSCVAPATCAMVGLQVAGGGSGGVGPLIDASMPSPGV